jgi:hypothetical protein
MEITFIGFRSFSVVFSATGGIDSRLTQSSIARELSLSLSKSIPCFPVSFPYVPLFLFPWIHC